MLYSSGSSSVYQKAKTLLPALLLAPRKVETSDPHELGAAFLRAELGQSKEPNQMGTPNDSGIGGAAFARPKGPYRRR